MSQQHPTEPNLESLREMTGAPDISEPLVSAADFDTEPIQSARPLWKLPIPKLVLIGLALLPVFALAGLFIAGGRQTQQAAPLGTPGDEDAGEAEGNSAETELEQAQAEIATLKAQMALEDQGQLEPAFSSSPQVPDSSQETPVPMPSSATVSPPRTRSAATSAVRSAPRTITTTPRSPAITAAPQPEIAVNPAERWRELAQLGSYGNVIPTESNEASGSITTIANQAEFTDRPISPAIAQTSSLPASPQITAHQASAPEASLSAIQPNFSTAESPNFELSTDTLPPMTMALEPSLAEAPAILAAAEARILQTTTSPSVLVVGTQSAAELATPVVLEAAVADSHYRVVLSEPLKDHQGQVAIPAGGELLVQVDAVSESGLVQLSAVQAVWEEQGWQRELQLPAGFVQVRGVAGTPLIADQYRDVGPEMAAMDAGQVAIGAVRRASELYNRTDTRVETGNGSTVVTESNSEPNLLAGLLEGGTEVLLDTLSERNQQAMEELAEWPRIAYIEAGRPVQIFINQTVQMPI
ncbi:MAG: hypothetical protein F6K00_29610 [Leptolyngbya sp. SIOISBB]|nr:hypothetical protein [Leptolyngbya sp. SIOISBB]